MTDSVECLKQENEMLRQLLKEAISGERHVEDIVDDLRAQELEEAFDKQTAALEDRLEKLKEKKFPAMTVEVTRSFEFSSCTTFGLTKTAYKQALKDIVEQVTVNEVRDDIITDYLYDYFYYDIRIVDCDDLLEPYDNDDNFNLYNRLESIFEGMVSEFAADNMPLCTMKTKITVKEKK